MKNSEKINVTKIRLNPANIQDQRAQSPTRIHSKTQQNVTSKDGKIGNLKKEIELLKQTQNENKRQFQTTLNENNKNETNNSKNGQMASAPGSQTHRNTELINVIHGNTVRT